MNESLTGFDIFLYMHFWVNYPFNVYFVSVTVSAKHTFKKKSSLLLW